MVGKKPILTSRLTKRPCTKRWAQPGATLRRAGLSSHLFSLPSRHRQVEQQPRFISLKNSHPSCRRRSPFTIFPCLFMKFERCHKINFIQVKGIFRERPQLFHFSAAAVLLIRRGQEAAIESERAIQEIGSSSDLHALSKKNWQVKCMFIHAMQRILYSVATRVFFRLKMLFGNSSPCSGRIRLAAASRFRTCAKEPKMTATRP